MRQVTTWNDRPVYKQEADESLPALYLSYYKTPAGRRVLSSD